MRAEKFRDADGEWRVRLISANGTVVLTSESANKTEVDRAGSALHDELGVRVTTARG